MIEFYISLLFSAFPLLPGNHEISIFRPDENNKVNSQFVKYNLSGRATFFVPNFSFKTLFRKLKIVNIIKIVKYIILEKQIIIFSSAPGETASLTEALLHLIFPLTWGCIYIPFMPLEMWEILNAMMPYIIGMSKVH